MGRGTLFLDLEALQRTVLSSTLFKILKLNSSLRSAISPVDDIQILILVLDHFKDLVMPTLEPSSETGYSVILCDSPTTEHGSGSPEFDGH